jgi:nitrous oxidase accessory protein
MRIALRCARPAGWITALVVVASMLPHSLAAMTPAWRLADTIIVSPQSGGAHPIADAVHRVARGGVVRLRAGVYAEQTIIIEQPLTLEGEQGAVLDGQGVRELLVVHADSVTIRRLTLRNTGTSQATDRAALRVIESAGCLIEYNRFENTLFGIYLQKSSACLVRRNVLDGMAGSQTVTGNGLHLWASRDIVLEDNVIRGHRDGIYFEFVRNSIARRNVSERSKRYGLHFMFSDSCRYEGNAFRENESGVAVMYSNHVHITDNEFVRNKGSAAYGLLLKEITDSEIRRNRFVDNSVAMHLEGASRDSITDNDFVRNGWAVRVLADAQDNVLRGNAFVGNVFDVGTNSRRNYSTFDGNFWDRYRGYDLDRNGTGDVAHSPVRLFALLVEQAPAALILTRSVLVDLLDAAERVLPMLSPETMRDRAPLMHAPRRLP